MTTKSRQVFLITSAAFFIFLACYLILFQGRETQYLESKEDYLYWAYSKGASETPVNEANPWYVEEHGFYHTIPFTTPMIVGRLAKIFHIPVMSFFPAVYFGFPFLLWGTFFFCLHWLWKYPLWPSAVVPGIFMEGTLFIRGVNPDTILRFTHPIDALWIVVFWISYILNPRPHDKRILILLGLLIFSGIWINPFLALGAVIVMVFEFAWQKFIQKDAAIARHLWRWILFTAASSVIYLAYVKYRMSENPWVFKMLAKEIEGGQMRDVSYYSIVFYAGLVLSVFSVKRILKTKLTALDRLVLFLFLVEPLFGNIQLLLGGNLQFSPKRYYYFLVEWLLLAGWFIEKMPLLMLKERFRKWSGVLVPVSLIFFAYTLTHGVLNPFRYGARSDILMYLQENNSRLQMTLIPVTFSLVWIYYRFSEIRRWMINPVFVTTVILCLSLGGYAGHARTLYGGKTEPFPFDGAYKWLNKHAAKDEVVLTIPPKRLRSDMVILRTDLKSFINPYADEIAQFRSQQDNHFRFFFYTSLLFGELKNHNQPVLAKTVEENLARLKLNYVLIDDTSPFYKNVMSELGDHLEEVYRDGSCILWKIKKPNGY